MNDLGLDDPIRSQASEFEDHEDEDLEEDQNFLDPR